MKFHDLSIAIKAGIRVANPILLITMGAFALMTVLGATRAIDRPMDYTVVRIDGDDVATTTRIAQFRREDGWQVDSATASGGQTMLLLKRYETDAEYGARYMKNAEFMLTYGLWASLAAILFVAALRLMTGTGNVADASLARGGAGSARNDERVAGES